MITIRPATTDDRQAIRTVIRESFLVSYVHFLPEERIELSLKNDRAGEIARDDGPDFTIAEVNGTPAGVMLLKDNFVEHLWAHPDFMGQGVGTALLEHAEREVRGRGHEQLALECFEKNTKSLGFYKSKGFVQERTYEAKDYMPGFYTCRMVKELRENS